MHYDGPAAARGQHLQPSWSRQSDDGQLQGVGDVQACCRVVVRHRRASCYSLARSLHIAAAVVDAAETKELGTLGRRSSRRTKSSDGDAAAAPLVLAVQRYTPSHPAAVLSQPLRAYGGLGLHKKDLHRRRCWSILLVGSEEIACVCVKTQLLTPRRAHLRDYDCSNNAI
jgi:hypothetical protein